MDHRPFEDWLHDNPALSADQKRQLNAHLRTCPSCTALAEVKLALETVSLAAPAAGFTDRFTVRLAARKKSLKRRNFWGFAILASSALGLLGWISWPVLKDLIQSPVNLFSSWLASLASFFTSSQAIIRAGMVLFRVVPGFIPTYIWLVVLFAAGGWSLIWVFSLMKFTKVPQGV